MKYLKTIWLGKTNRTGYVLSVLCVVLGLFLHQFYLNPFDICYVCRPPELFPWEEIVELFGATKLGGGYLCVLFCWGTYKTSWAGYSIIIPILLTAYYYVQTIKRCHDIGCSGWRSLIPVYSSLFLFFIKSKNENEHLASTHYMNNT